MTDMEAIQARHAVRQYEAKPLAPQAVSAIKNRIGDINYASGLHLQLVTGEKQAFNGGLMHFYGNFKGVDSYIVVAGGRTKNLEEAAGYYGERLVLDIQKMGLNTCWVGGTYRRMRSAWNLNPDDHVVCVIAVGYGATQGVAVPVKPLKEVTRDADLDRVPAWYLNGVKAAQLAPSSMNQKKYSFCYNSDGTVNIDPGIGVMTKVDMGIAKLHFEIGSGKDRSIWA